MSENGVSFTVLRHTLSSLRQKRGLSMRSACAGARRCDTAPMKQIRLATAMLGALIVGQAAVSAGAQETGKPRFVLVDEAGLTAMKARVKAGDAALSGAAADLRKQADELLTRKPPAVTDKPGLPVGNDKHDYMSLAIYYWPNPNTPDGKPYVNRDGQVNRKEVNEGDSPRKDQMVSAVRTLTLAYHMFDEPKYAEGAAKYLRVWFFDPETRMNPNLNHAQYVPGQSEGRGYGIIETRSLVQLVDAVRLLEGSSAWTSADREGFAAWMNAFVDWLLTSKNGKEEAAAANNHGDRKSVV